jgi:UDP-N-acetyl-D-mannosaminuronic acid transferase (WecB/TagA/CpsF family)
MWNIGINMNPAETVSNLSVQVPNLSQQETLELLGELIDRRWICSHSISIINAPTLNLAAEDMEYLKVINSIN